MIMHRDQINGIDVFMLVQDILCSKTWLEENSSINNTRSAFLSSGQQSVGQIPGSAPNITLLIEGGDKIGENMIISVANISETLSAEFVDCDLHAKSITLPIIKNKTTTSVGEYLKTTVSTSSSFNMLRFSMDIDELTAFEVKCEVLLNENEGSVESSGSGEGKSSRAVLSEAKWRLHLAQHLKHVSIFYEASRFQVVVSQDPDELVQLMRAEFNIMKLIRKTKEVK
ncbi:Oidioi.mRNA.OKI2018_I69.chr2.g4208.t1.cds [Oikopleura dioica]|uniref:Oidioi.mRNA.OKI2018_I69.chr2.g4208.t1.cds n=1 Tax=Oikopleura dioica TaxID=34765 RepID=A0ABN7SWL5_OIKDI|nr:Oidioi.mRNA.OKI2018_I69.chr2.g4208.t1.cds [Oikopleura dioica]